MATIKRGLTQFVFNGFTIPLAEQNWLPAIDAIYKINPDRVGWASYVRDEPFPGFENLERDAFYLIKAFTQFDLPDAQIIACASGETSAVIPSGLNQFVYSGASLLLSTAPWRNNVKGLHEVYTDGQGWKSFDPDFPFNSLQSLQSGGFYLVNATGSFDLPGAQLIGCAETFAKEKIDGTLFVKYLDLLNEIPPEVTPADLKTAPNTDLFRRTIQGLTVGEHNHDDRYYPKTETLSTAEINALFQGIDEVIPKPNFGEFPQPGLESKLYIDEQFNVGYRWTGTEYIAVSSPGTDLTPYLTKNEASNTYQVKGNYLTVEAGNNTYQPKGNYQPAGAYVKSVSINGGGAYIPDVNGKVNLPITGNTPNSSFQREVEDFVYEGNNIFSLTYIPTRVYHVFPNGFRTKLFTNNQGEITIDAQLENGWPVAIDYHHNGVLNGGIFDFTFDETFE